MKKLFSLILTVTVLLGSLALGQPTALAAGNFTLGKSNNSFTVFNSSENDGFYGVSDYEIAQSTIRAKLFEYANAYGAGTASAVLDNMYSGRSGSPFGETAVMGLYLRGSYDNNDISSYKASNFYSLQRPSQNPLLLDTINYYQLLQYIENCGYTRSIDTSVSLKSSSQKGKSNFFKALITAVTNNMYNAVIVGFDGNTLLTTSISQSGNVYTIKLYNPKVRTGLDTLTITNSSGNYAARYERSDNPGENIINNLSYMRFMTLTNLQLLIPYTIEGNDDFPLVPVSSVSAIPDTDIMKIAINLNDSFVINIGDDGVITNENGLVESNLDILNTQYVESDSDSSKLIIQLTKDEKITYTPTDGCDSYIAVYDEDNYLSAAGENISEIDINLNGTVLFSGENYSFKSALNRSNGGNNELVMFDGSACDDTAIYNNGFSSIAASNADMTAVNSRIADADGITEAVTDGSGSVFVLPMNDDCLTDLSVNIASINSAEGNLCLCANGKKIYSSALTNGITVMQNISCGNYDVFARPKFGVTKKICESYTIENGNQNLNINDFYFPIGDVNNDEVINISDVSECLLAGNYGKSNDNIDIDHDGSIGINDISLIILNSNYGQSSDEF